MAKSEEQHIIAPQPGSQELAMSIKADLIIYGGAAGSGKSHLLLMHPLQYVDDPNFNAVYFRRVTTQLTGLGGLWEESKKLYAPFKTKTKIKPQLTHEFKKSNGKYGGAKFQFMHMQHEDNKTDHQGLQYSAIFFDELTHFSQTQFVYLLSRLRSDADSGSYAMGTCNPDPDSWVLKWIEWWLDADGYPDKAKQGIVRYYLTIGDEPVFADTPQELKEQFPDACRVWNQNEEVWIDIEPKSFTFISGTIFDNPALLKKNPKYLSELNSLNSVDKARLLYGNWYARAQASGLFKREWLRKVDRLPPGVKKVRAWDKAAAVPAEQNMYPDYTASIGLAKDTNGYYYLFGDFCPEAKDEKSEIYGRFRRRPGERDAIILKQTQYDGDDTLVVLPIDPGAAGKSEYLEASKKLIVEGFKVIQDPSPSTKSKLKKYEPFSSACENGLVYIVESSFPNKATLEAFLKENEAFNGERSSAQRKDDWPDTCASAFNSLAKEKVIPKFSLSVKNADTRRKEVMNQTVPNFNK